MVFEVGEEKVDMPKNTRLNQYSTMGVLKGNTEEELIKKITDHEGQLFIKSIYFSPTSNQHVAYVLSNSPLTKEV